MYDEWFAKLRVEDDDLATLEEQQALLDYMNGHSTAEVAAQRYTSLVSKSDDPNCMYIWSLLIAVASSLAETQDRLVSLLQAIQDLPPLRNEKEGGTEEGFWKSLPGLAFDLREKWDGLLSTVTDGRHKSEIEHLVNLTAFNARILSRRIMPLEHWAAQTFRIVLENDYNGRRALLDELVPVAAQYIFHAGRAVYDCEDEMVVPPRVENFTFPGPLWNGRQGLSKERWALWKARFHTIGELDNIQEKTREVAKKVARDMTEIESHKQL